MAAKVSAGLLLYRRTPSLELLLGHMGGPFWARKDDRAWSIPKGEYPSDEEAFAAARREFAEELGSPPPDVDYLDLGSERLPGGKVLRVWAGESDFDATPIISNSFDLEWPPRSGRMQAFPEIDRARWCTPDLARSKLVASQVVFVDRLLAML
ncbi:MAG TPA: NUDIX domain-containing protein [Jatrophihabitantaceae bacterium]|nr:NUDIX domain-containing protein [Jatrophihabitantaceae bacterium]